MDLGQLFFIFLSVMSVFKKKGAIAPYLDRLSINNRLHHFKVIEFIF